MVARINHSTIEADNLGVRIWQGSSTFVVIAAAARWFLNVIRGVRVRSRGERRVRGSVGVQGVKVIGGEEAAVRGRVARDILASRRGRSTASSESADRMADGIDVVAWWW
jgi:hypothetical protein